MGIIDFLDRMDRRIIFIAVIILSMVPVAVPFGLPITIGESTQKSYDALESLQEGDIICISGDYGGGSAAELYPIDLVIAKHAFKKNLRLVTISFGVANAEVAQILLKESGYIDNRERNVDYVHLGYVAGSETAMSSFASDPHALIQTDYFGTQLEDIPLMDEVHDIEDFAYLSFCTATSADHWCRQFTGYSTMVVANMLAVFYSPTKGYEEAGQLVGILNGLRGAAEYELLTKEYGAGITTMDQVSATHAFAVIMLIVGNIAYWIRRERGEVIV